MLRTCSAPDARVSQKSVDNTRARRKRKELLPWYVVASPAIQSPIISIGFDFRQGKKQEHSLQLQEKNLTFRRRKKGEPSLTDINRHMYSLRIQSISHFIAHARRVIVMNRMYETRDGPVNGHSLRRKEVFVPRRRLGFHFLSQIFLSI